MKLSFPLDLRARLVMLLLLAFSILFLIPVWHYLQERDQQMKAAKAELLAKVKLIAARQDYLVRRGETILASLALQADLGPQGSLQSCRQYLLARLSQEPEFVQISKVLPDGDIVCAALQPANAINIANRPYFQRTLRSQEMLTSDVVYGQILKKPIIIFSKAVRNSQNNVTHVFLLALGMDWIGQEIARSELPEGARISVLDVQGDVLMRFPDPEAWIGKNAAHSPAIKQLISGPAEGVFENVTIDGMAKLFAHVPLLGTDAGSQYRLLLSIPRHVVEAPIRRESLLTFGVMLAVLAATIAAVLLGGHRLLIQPLQGLTRAAARFNGGDYSIRSGLAHGTDLLGRLAQTLDQSAAAIAERDSQLHRSEARYRTLVEMSPDAVVVQREGRIVYVNRAAIALFAGRTEAAFIGRIVKDFIHPDCREIATARFSALAKQGDAVVLVRQKLLKLDGSAMDVEVQSIAILFNDVLAIQIHVHDLTRRLQRESEMERMRGEMQAMMEWQVARHTVAALAHEINQPLASVAALSEAARRMVQTARLMAGTPPQQTQPLEAALEHIGNESERAGKVLRNLLRAVHRPETTLELVDLSEVLQAVWQEFLLQQGNGCEIVLRCPANLPRVMVNRLQISKVLHNLITNGVQAMLAAAVAYGRIWLEAALQADGSRLLLTVRDEGPGIAAALRHQIFHPFVTTKADGLGMGLAICRTLVELHGGKIWYDAKNLSGAQFCLTLPLTDLTV